MNSNIKRKKIRLNQNLYCGDYVYFITICSYSKKSYFGEIKDGKIHLNKIGEIIEHKIINLPKFFDCRIDKYVIMPNHIHFLISENVVSIFKIMSSFKRHCFQEIRNLVNTGDIRSPLQENITLNNKIWQKSFYDRIIRNQKEYDLFWQYIDENPLRWELDSLNPEKDI
jgi:putative transposase